MEFRSYKVSDVVNIISGGTPKRKNEAYWNGDIPWLSIKDFNNDSRRVYETEEYISEEGLNNSSATLVKPGTVIVSARGTVGATCQVGKSMTFNQSSFGLHEKKGITTNDYIYYWLNYKLNYLKNNVHGSVFDTINRKTFDNLNIELPSIYNQKSITKVLVDIDNKIEINQNIIANLEELSQVLFKRWFVDFEFPDEKGDPYKSNGGKFKESAIGDIPLDWEASVFNNFIEENIAGDWGKATPQKNYNSKVTIIRGADIPQLKKGDPGAPPSRYILEKNKDKKQIQNGDIVIEVSGGSPTQSTGRTLYINENILDRFRTPVLSTNFCRILRPKAIEYGQWLELYFQYLYEKNVFFNFENGTTGIKNFDYKAILTKFNIISPTNDIIRKFHYEINYLRDHIQNLGSENQKLSELRDTLLPKLMSGEIELPDTLEVTEDAELLQRG